jgi:hypothetical protein
LEIGILRKQLRRLAGCLGLKRKVPRDGDDAEHDDDEDILEYVQEDTVTSPAKFHATIFESLRSARLLFLGKSAPVNEHALEIRKPRLDALLRSTFQL